MLAANLIALVALLPFLAGVSGLQPPHLRHRNLAKAIRHLPAHGGEAPRALVPRDPSQAHREAYQMIKRNMHKRQCAVASSPASSPTSSPTSSPAPSPTDSDSSSESSWTSSIQDQQAWAQGQSSAPSSPAWTPSSSDSWTGSWTTSSSWSSQPTGGLNNGGGGISVSVGGLLDITIGSCGWCGSSDNEPNGSQDWLNCGINGGGWQPPMVTVDQLIVADLDDSSVFAPCSDYIGMMNTVGQQYNLPPILLASFAMQESTCNPGATGANGEQGLMQITPANCPSGDNCYDPWTNLQVGAQLLQNNIQSSGNNILQAVAQMNGWYPSLTLQEVQGAAVCTQRQNLDYLYQMMNYWLQNKNAQGQGQYTWLMQC